jgi:serine/threonine protein kinase
MNAFPDFSTHGYQIEKELGHNSLGGRVTYLAKNTNTQKLVVIKQFQFAQLGASWTEYEAYEQEIKVLQNLDFPGIPRYLDSFQTDSGFCMVQEYKNAESAVARTFSPPDIKQIAIATLEILVNLQAQKPPIIHRDIKPENLLIDDELNVYLVDFGFARLGGGNIAASSVVKGTMGFMPPEQMFNRNLTKASDLYGLGITLICLLTGTKSVDVGNLIDANYSIHFRHLVPPLQQGWMNWLETMVAPRIQDRYQSAADALAVLKSLDVSRLPKVRIERDLLKFTATEYGEILTRAIEISNPIPNTMLAGRWEVAPHPNDPPHTPYDHSWIFFEPQKLEGNEVECTITVDTSKLLPSQTYYRQIILHANSEPDSYKIAIEVQTASFAEPIQTPYISRDRLTFMFLFIGLGFLLSSEMHREIFFMFLPVLVTGFTAAEKTLYAEMKGIEINWLGSVLGGTCGTTVMFLAGNTFELMFAGGFGNNSIGKEIALLLGFVVSALLGASVGSLVNRRGLNLIALLLGFVVSALLRASGGSFVNRRGLYVASGLVIFTYLVLVQLGAMSELPLFIAMGVIFIFLVNSACWVVVYALVKARISEQVNIGFFKQDALNVTFLTAGFCISLGSGIQLFLKFKNEIGSLENLKFLVLGGSALASLAVTAIPLLNLIIFKRNRILANYRKSKPNFIKP